MIRRLLEAIKAGWEAIARVRDENHARRKAIAKIRREHESSVMYDSIELSQIPASAPAILCYVGGRWPTCREIQPHQFPNARHRLTTAVTASETAELLDIEVGDATPEEAPAWVKARLSEGVRRPAVYASVSDMPRILAILKGAGIRRRRIRVCTAHYTDIPHLCDSSCNPELKGHADGTQYTDHFDGRNLDAWLLHRGFWR